MEENEKYIFDIVAFLEEYHYRKKNITNINEFISNVNFNYLKVINYNNFFLTKKDQQNFYKNLITNLKVLVN